MYRRIVGWAGWHTPGIHAFGIQALAAVLTWMLAAGLFHFLNLQMSIGIAVVMTGLLAAIATALSPLARWWIAIQMLFPVALLSTFALHVPPLLFLLAFLFLVALYWSTFRTQVPFYPSGPAVWSAVLALLPAGRPLRVIDIGSGLGGLVLRLATHRPESHFTGIELAPLPWIVSRLHGLLKRSSAAFVLGDYDKLDFADYDVIFAYLSPAAMPALWLKAQREMRPGTLLLSYEFSIPDHTPDLTVLPHPQGPALYGWQR